MPTIIKLTPIETSPVELKFTTPSTLEVVIDSQSGKIVAGPDIHARGFTEDKSLFDDVKGDIEKALSKAVAGGFNGTHQLSQVVRKTIGSWVGEEHRRKPMIIPLIATSHGYFTSDCKETIQEQIKSLQERANSITRCANGLKKFL